MSQGRFWFWRDTAREPQFLGVDARACAPFVLFLAHMRLWTFVLSVVTVLVFAALSKFGLTLSVFRNALVRRMAGPVVMARPWWYWQRFLRK